MSKYIIDTDQFEKLFEIKGVAVLGIGDNPAVPEEGEKTVWTRMLNVADLEELNSDYINEHFGDLHDTAYQRGLDDAWEAAKKVVLSPEEGGMSTPTLFEIFRRGSVQHVFRNYSASQVIEKLKAYEQKQNDKIEVGDEVKHKSEGVTWTAIVTRIRCGTLTLMGHSGASADNYPIEDFVKTGRHFDIKGILEEMKA